MKQTHNASICIVNFKTHLASVYRKAFSFYQPLIILHTTIVCNTLLRTYIVILIACMFVVALCSVFVCTQSMFNPYKPS